MSDLIIAGMGPGGRKGMSFEVWEALEKADLIVGYTTYVELVKNWFPHKETLTTGMRSERERCAAAIEEALKGRNTVMICSGDAVVYGMAGLILEELEKRSDEERESISLHILPGITAALSTSALLGAPLTNDFAVISLSDLLTPFELIEKRLRGAIAGEFCICLYNPASTKRKLPWQTAMRLLLEARGPKTLCGWARQVGREEESCRIMTLGELAQEEPDMFTTVIIGNSEMRLCLDKLLTPRGYHRKED